MAVNPSTIVGALSLVAGPQTPAVSSFLSHLYPVPLTDSFSYSVGSVNLQLFVADSNSGCQQSQDTINDQYGKEEVAHACQTRPDGYSSPAQHLLGLSFFSLSFSFCFIH